MHGLENKKPAHVNCLQLFVALSLVAALDYSMIFCDRNIEHKKH